MILTLYTLDNKLLVSCLPITTNLLTIRVTKSNGLQLGKNVGHMYQLVSFLHMATNLLTIRVTKSNRSIGEEGWGQGCALFMTLQKSSPTKWRQILFHLVAWIVTTFTMTIRKWTPPNGNISLQTWRVIPLHPTNNLGFFGPFWGLQFISFFFPDYCV